MATPTPNGGIAVPVSAEFDRSATDREVERLTGQLNTLGRLVSQLNRQKFSPVDKGTLADMQAITKQFESFVKIQGQLRSRLKATGQQGRSIGDIDWERVYPDSSQRARAMRSMFEYSTASTQFAGRLSQVPVAPPPGRPPGGGSGGGGGGGDDMPPSFPGQGVVNAGLGAAGPVGRIAAGSLGTAMRGGLMAGVGAFVGGLAAFGAAKGVGAIKDKVSDAEGEAIGYDTLKRVLGDVSVDFSNLRDSLRQAAVVVNTNFAEVQRLSMEFAKLSNTTAAGQRQLAGEVAVGGGLARALGLDLGAGVGVMATSRQYGLTRNEDDSRRLALMIGETVARVGFAKSDEILAQIQQFTQMQARAALSAPNIGGYLGALGGLAGSGRAGLDVGGSAALLSRVNATIMAGGGMGEAGSNFMLANVGKPLGLSPIQTRMLLQQGAFGTGRMAFGNGSLYSTFASRFGGGGAGRAGVSDMTNLDAVLGGLRRNYGGLGADYLASSTANLLGISETQAMAMHVYGARGVGSIEKRLKGKIPMSALNPSAFGALAAIQTGGMDVLNAQAASLRSRTGGDALTSDDLKRLNDAMGSGNTETMRQVLTELTATREQETTDGKLTRDSIEHLDREFQKLAGELVPLTAEIREAVAAMAETLAPESVFGKAAAERKRFRDNDLRYDEIKGNLDKFDAQTEAFKNSDRYKGLSESNKKSWARDRALMRRPLEDALEREYGGAGMSAAALMNGLIRVESGGRHVGPDGKLIQGEMLSDGERAQGITQIKPSTGKSPGFGVKALQDDSQAEYLRFSQDYLAALMRHYGGDARKSLAAYNWGVGRVDQWGSRWEEHAPPGVLKYVNDVMGAGGAPGARPGHGLTEYHADLVLHPKTPDGKAAGAPVRVRVATPAASGASR